MSPEPAPEAVDYSPLPEWALAIKCDRIDRTSDDSWLFQWKDGPCTLIDFYDDGDVVVMGLDPSPEIPDRRSYCETKIENREWIEAFAAHGWNQERFKQ